jgi:hypothetical protein
MVNMEMTAIADIENRKDKRLVHTPEHLTVGFDQQRKLYFVRIGFTSLNESDKVKEVEVTSAKLLQPFANWVLFVLACKNECKLSHQDLSTSKFRMVEYWNKDAEIKLTQEQLFNNDRGFFDLKLNVSNVHLENPSFLRSKFIIREAVLKHEDVFKSVIDLNSTENNLSRTFQQDRLIDLLFNLNS